MSRSIVTQAPSEMSDGRRTAPGPEPAPGPVTDSYFDKLLKLIPAEVIAVYLSMHTVLRKAGEDESLAFVLGTFVFGVFLTFFYLKVVLKVANFVQILVSVGAFCVWAYAIFEPPESAQFAWHNGTLAALALLGYTAIAPHIPLTRNVAQA